MQGPSTTDTDEIGYKQSGQDVFWRESPPGLVQAVKVYSQKGQMKRQQKDGPFLGKEYRFRQELEVDSPFEKELAI